MGTVFLPHDIVTLLYCPNQCLSLFFIPFFLILSSSWKYLAKSCYVSAQASVQKAFSICCQVHKDPLTSRQGMREKCNILLHVPKLKDIELLALCCLTKKKRGTLASLLIFQLWWPAIPRMMIQTFLPLLAWARLAIFHIEHFVHSKKLPREESAIW